VKFKETLPPGARTFESRLRVQWGDVDIAGIMYFAAYWRFAERAEMDFFNELGFPYSQTFVKYDIWLARVRVEAEYHAPALMDDWMRMRTHVTKVGASSIHWETVVFNERTGDAGAVCRFTIACMDRNKLRSRPLPPELRAALTACVGAPA
jgi:acyl-CoA thioester hydrolase